MASMSDVASFLNPVARMERQRNPVHAARLQNILENRAPSPFQKWGSVPFSPSPFPLREPMQLTPTHQTNSLLLRRDNEPPNESPNRGIELRPMVNWNGSL